MKLVLLTLLMVAVAVKGTTQQPAHFFLGQQEFEGVQVYDVIEDNQLNYWFATDQGFYKYDGYDFITVSCKGLRSQAAFGFVKNSKGQVFCHNLNNQVLKIENGECSVFYELAENERSSDIFLAVTSENSLLILSRTLILFDESGKKIPLQNVRDHYYGFPFQSEQGTTISHINGADSVMVIENNQPTIRALINRSEPVKGLLKFFRIHESSYAVDITSRIIYAFNESDFSITPLPVQLLQSEKEFMRFYNEENLLWIAGTVSGVRIIADPAFNVSPALQFSQYLISDVYRDHEGNLLLSTFNYGVIVIPNLKIPDVLPISTEHSIVSLCYDNELGLLMGTLKGELIYFDDTDYKLLSSQGSRPLQAVYSWSGFPYIVFDDGSIKVCHKKTGEITEVLEASLKDASMIDQSSICLALNRGIYKLSINAAEEVQVENYSALQLRSYAIAFEPVNKIIYAATSDGLKIIDQNEVITPFLYEGMPVFANDIAVKGHTVFIATKENGILVAENGKVVKTITPEINQHPAEVSKLKVVDDLIYINTSEGFGILDQQGKIIMQLNKVYGFSTNKIFDFDLVDDQLWIAHSKGVQKLDPAHFNTSTPVPLIAISSIAVNDSLLADLIGAGEFNNASRKFLFTFSSPTLRNKENIRYHYQLEGYDTRWQIAPYYEHSAIYNALEPGSYTFRVKAENQGVFSEAVAYSFLITQPWYLRWWFILALIIVFIMVTVFIYRFQLKKQRKKAELINEINLSKLAAIQSQMNPHFIFNSLNSIQDLVLKGDIDNSYTFIAKFSDLIRRTLNYSDKEMIEFDQEIKLLELYLSLEKLRFRSDLEYTINHTPVEGMCLPPMLVQPFIENALVHGLLHKEGKKKITITFQLTDILICIIEDNGVGRAKAKEIKKRQGSIHESFSGEAIKKRFAILRQHFKGELGFEYEDLYENNEASGTRVRIHIPVRFTF